MGTEGASKVMMGWSIIWRTDIALKFQKIEIHWFDESIEELRSAAKSTARDFKKMAGYYRTK
jgi:hypothetical protein